MVCFPFAIFLHAKSDTDFQCDWVPSHMGPLVGPGRVTRPAEVKGPEQWSSPQNDITLSISFPKSKMGPGWRKLFGALRQCSMALPLYHHSKWTPHKSAV